VSDLITEILGGGGSSRLFQALVKRKKNFSAILNVIILETIDCRLADH
jgi:hypothetical protein